MSGWLDREPKNLQNRKKCVLFNNWMISAENKYIVLNYCNYEVIK